MIEKLKESSLKIKNIFTNTLKKNRKIDEYKKRKKEKGNKKKEIKRSRYSIQLNMNLRWKQNKNILIFFVVFLLIVILIITKWPYFKIKKINIISPDWISNTYIIDKTLQKLQNSLIFKVNKTEIQNTIKNIEQNIDSVIIEKDFPDTLNIRVISSPIILKTNINWKQFVITKNWVLIPNNNKKSEILEISLKNFELQNYPNYKKILKEINLQKIIYIRKQLKDNITNIKIEDIIYYKTEKEIHFIINNKTRLIFNLESNNKDELKQLFVFNKEKINITKPWIVYIDNRIKAKILYCPSSELNSCIKSINYIYNENYKNSDYEEKK